MIFDSFAKFVTCLTQRDDVCDHLKKNCDTLFCQLKKTHVFILEKDLSPNLLFDISTSRNDEEKLLLEEECLLPFSNMCICDNNHCNMLIDNNYNKRGLKGKELEYYAFAHLSERESIIGKRDLLKHARENAHIRELLTKQGIMSQLYSQRAIETNTLTHGFIICDFDRPMAHKIAMDYFFSIELISGDQKFYGSEEQENNDGVRLFYGVECIEKALYFNSPNKFILEVSPSKTKQDKKRIKRSHERPLYKLLTPNVIRKQMKLPPPSVPGCKKAPHERRAHPRRLSSERYTEEKRGSVVWIKSTWIGKKENTVDNKRYRVLV